jgi:hypothetical protein
MTSMVEPKVRLVREEDVLCIQAGETALPRSIGS